MRRIAVFLLISWALSGCQSQTRRPDQWVAQLASPADCVIAYQHLDGAREAQTIDALLVGLSDRSAQVRARCARLLSRCEALRQTAPLFPLLDDEDVDVRIQAALALAEWVDASRLLEMMNSPRSSWHVRLALASALSSLQVEGTDNVLCGWLQDARVPVHIQAQVPCFLFNLHAFGKWPLLRRIYLDQRRPLHLRAACLAELAGTPDYIPLAELRSILADQKLPYPLRGAVVCKLAAKAPDDLRARFRDPAEAVSLRLSCLAQLLNARPPDLGVAAEALRQADRHVRLCVASWLCSGCCGTDKATLLQLARSAVAVETAQDVEAKLRRAILVLQGKQGAECFTPLF